MAVDNQTRTSLMALTELEQNDSFTHRHIGPDVSEQQQMLTALGMESLDEPGTANCAGKHPA